MIAFPGPTASQVPIMSPSNGSKSGFSARARKRVGQKRAPGVETRRTVNWLSANSEQSKASIFSRCPSAGDRVSPAGRSGDERRHRTALSLPYGFGARLCLHRAPCDGAHGRELATQNFVQREGEADQYGRGTSAAHRPLPHASARLSVTLRGAPSFGG